MFFYFTRINVRIEHVTHSKCREDFLKRVKENERLRKEAREKKIKAQLKRKVSIYLTVLIHASEANIINLYCKCVASRTHMHDLCGHLSL